MLLPPASPVFWNWTRPSRECITLNLEETQTRKVERREEACKDPPRGKAKECPNGAPRCTVRQCGREGSGSDQENTLCSRVRAPRGGRGLRSLGLFPFGRRETGREPEAGAETP